MATSQFLSGKGKTKHPYWQKLDSTILQKAFSEARIAVVKTCEWQCHYFFPKLFSSSPADPTLVKQRGENKCYPTFLKRGYEKILSKEDEKMSTLARMAWVSFNWASYMQWTACVLRTDHISLPPANSQSQHVLIEWSSKNLNTTFMNEESEGQVTEFISRNYRYIRRFSVGVVDILVHRKFTSYR